MLVTTKTRILNQLIKQNGVVYTPTILANYVAEKVVGFFVKDLIASGSSIDLNKTRVIDPACGEGELLIAVWQALENTLNHKQKIQLNYHDIFCGIDIDQESVNKSIERIKDISTKKPNKGRHNFIATNALFPENTNKNDAGWDSVKKRFGAQDGFDILIANPPWGADISSYAEELENSDFILKHGHIETSDLFIELALSAVKPGGYFAFIIPDSLFSFERRKLRKMLTTQTEIKYVGRFGEKIFPGINRACAVLICKKTTPKATNKIRCMRLNPFFRNEILACRISFAEAEKILGHDIQQKRFSKSPDFLFDIDTREDEREVIDKIADSTATVGKYVTSSRGVELSKTGKVCRCPKCEYWMPLPSSKKPKCSHCDSIIDLTKTKTEVIISKKRFKGSKPILVGESVRRYSITSRYWISVDNKGINYKSISLYHEPKILVRKTGVGITATIDYSSALTNQVVYIFRSKLDLKELVPIEFILAVMNSRAIYYFLLKKYGETEWRSHPYLTQAQILNLPIAELSTKISKEIQSRVVALLKPYLEKHEGLPSNVDAEVEFLIAKLFGLTRKDYDVIYKTLSDTQGLIPVKSLASVSVQNIFSFRKKKYGT